ncbi:hypothetical protein QZH41_013501 [Actinostola sp. cb2023]|nr:hypothetical protein QZH41_013501 [Actinostola sp. cb2023]
MGEIQSEQAYIDNDGHSIAELVHDNVPAIQKWAINEKHIMNSYDTWHVKATKTHFYYTMKRFSDINGDQEEFRLALLNIISHYQSKVREVYENLDKDWDLLKRFSDQDRNVNSAIFAGVRSTDSKTDSKLIMKAMRVHFKTKKRQHQNKLQKKDLQVLKEQRRRTRLNLLYAKHTYRHLNPVQYLCPAGEAQTKYFG